MNSLPNGTNITHVTQSDAIQTNTDARLDFGIRQIQESRPKWIVAIGGQIFTNLDGGIGFHDKSVAQKQQEDKRFVDFVAILADTSTSTARRRPTLCHSAWRLDNRGLPDAERMR